MVELHLFNTVKYYFWIEQGQVSNTSVFLEWKLEKKGGAYVFEQNGLFLVVVPLPSRSSSIIRQTCTLAAYS